LPGDQANSAIPFAGNIAHQTAEPLLPQRLYFGKVSRLIQPSSPLLRWNGPRGWVFLQFYRFVERDRSDSLQLQGSHLLLDMRLSVGFQFLLVCEHFPIRWLLYKVCIADKAEE
jgi:hypothetical protein